MPLTQDGHRYRTLLLGAGITSGEIETELADAARLADLRGLLLDQRLRRAVLLAAWSIVSASGKALNEVLTRGLAYAGSTVTTALEGLVYPSETNYVLSQSLTRDSIAGMSAPKYGLGYASSYSQSATNWLDKFNFSVNAMMQTSASFTNKDDAGATQSVNSGYLMGGRNGASTYLSSIHQVSFEADTMVALSATLNDTRDNTAGMASSTHGYCAGGDDGAVKTEIDGVVFATNAAYNPAVVLGAAKEAGGGSESATKGYYIGGNTGSRTAVVEALTFAGETIANLADALDSARDSVTAVRSSYASYALGGNIGGSSTTAINKLLHATEANGDISAALSVANRGSAALYGFGV